MCTYIYVHVVAGHCISSWLYRKLFTCRVSESFYRDPPLITVTMPCYSHEAQPWMTLLPKCPSRHNFPQPQTRFPTFVQHAWVTNISEYKLLHYCQWIQQKSSRVDSKTTKLRYANWLGARAQTSRSESCIISGVVSVWEITHEYIRSQGASVSGNTHKHTRIQRY